MKSKYYQTQVSLEGHAWVGHAPELFPGSPVLTVIYRAPRARTKSTQI